MVDRNSPTGKRRRKENKMNQGHPTEIMAALDFHSRPSMRKIQLAHIDGCPGCLSFLGCNPGISRDIENMRVYLESQQV